LTKLVQSGTSLPELPFLVNLPVVCTSMSKIADKSDKFLLHYSKLFRGLVFVWTQCICSYTHNCSEEWGLAERECSAV